MKNIDILKRIYEDLKIAFIHEESFTISMEEIEVILDVLDKVEGID